MTRPRPTLGRRVTVSLALISLVVAGCAGTASTPSPPQGSTGPSPSTAMTPQPSGSVALQHLRSAVTTVGALQWPYYVAQAKGWYKQAGIDIENIVAGTNTKEVQGLLSGSLDVAGGSPDVLIKAVAQNNSNLVIVGAVMNRPVYSMIAQPDITSWADLKGKRVGVSAVLSMDGLWMKDILAANGLNPGDYEMVEVGGTADRYKALVAKGISAAWLSQPQDFTALGQGFKLLGLSTDVVKGIVWSGYNTTTTFAQNHKDLLDAFLGVQCRAAKWLYDPANKAEAISILVKETNSDETAVGKTYDLWINQQSLSQDGSTNDQAVQTMIDALVANQQLTAPIAVSKVFDPSYMNGVTSTDCKYP